MGVKELNEMLMNAGISGYAKEWNGRRIYINLDACDKSFAGNRNYQFYYDLTTKKLVSQSGKGIAPSSFLAEVERVEKLFNH